MTVPEPLSRVALREVQLEILDQVDAFCRERGLPYFLCGGTLLGAVRHGGYIPWDDDIDLMMLRPDYERFIAEFPGSRQARHLELNVLSTDDGWPYPYMKIADTRSRMLEEARHDAVFGVNIDVFPLAGMWASRPRRFVQSLQVDFLRSLHTLTIMEQRQGRAWYKRLFLSCAQVVLRSVPATALARRWDRVSHRYPVRAGALVGLRNGLVDWEVPYEALLPTALLDFEGRRVMGPADPDLVLIAMFGEDYMTPPSADQQVSPHRYQAFRL